MLRARQEPDRERASVPGQDIVSYIKSCPTPVLIRCCATLLALLVLPLALAACGNGEEGEDATPPGQAEPETTRPAPGQNEQPETTRPDTPGESAPESRRLPDEGEPRRRGGEASIEDFGVEAEGSGRTAIVGAFRGYLSALVGENYATACSRLAGNVKRSLRQFAPPDVKRRGCAAILPRLLAPTAATIAREQAGGEITRVRIEGDEAFVVFRAPGAVLYQMPMAREDGEWKVTLVAASVLVPDLDQ